MTPCSLRKEVSAEVLIIDAGGGALLGNFQKGFLGFCGIPGGEGRQRKRQTLAQITAKFHFCLYFQVKPRI